MDEAYVREFCKRASINLIAKMKTCVGCMEAKAKRKPVRKITNTRATKPGERIYVDTSGPLKPDRRGYKYWFKIVDDYSRKNWNFFMKAKSEVTKELEKFILMMKDKDIVIEKIRCDNAGEHQSEFQALCSKHKITLEFVAPSTPQHNGVVERAFTTDLWRLKAMMRQANFATFTKNMFWTYAIKVLEKLSNMAMTTGNPDNKSPDAMFGTEDLSIAHHLVEFGRIGYVAIRKKILGKSKPRSKKCVMIGYAENHSADTYILYDTEKRSVIMSRDIRWADFERPYASDDLDLYRSREENEQPQRHIDSTDNTEELLNMPNQGGNNDDDDYIKLYYEFEEDSDSEVNEENQESVNEDVPIDANEENEEQIPQTRSRANRAKNKRVLRALRQLDGTSYNSEANKRLKGIRGNHYPVRNINHRIYSTAIISDPGEPNTIWEALNGDDKEQWLPSIKSEVMNFIKRKSWEYVSITEPKDKGRKLIPCKWVFKIKDEQDGSKRYKSRLCVKGFHQIPGVDYTESFSPVATESTINILLLYTLWKCN